jgi:hypothetical protein
MRYAGMVAVISPSPGRGEADHEFDCEPRERDRLTGEHVRIDAMRGCLPLSSSPSS